MADEKRLGPSDSPADAAEMSCRDVVMAATADEGRVDDRPDRRLRRVQLAIAGVSLALVLGSAGYFALNPDVMSMGGGSSASQMGSDADGDTFDAESVEGVPVALDATPAEGPSENSDGRSSSAPSGPSGGNFDDPTDGSNASNSNPGGNSSQQGGGGQADNPATGTQKPTPKTVTVSISVDSSAVGSPVSASGTFTFEEGATVYDALCALGLSIGSQDSVHGVYVSSINGLAEKDHGASSGWMYAVNGRLPNMACSAYKLGDGDVIQWRYVTGQ